MALSSKLETHNEQVRQHDPLRSDVERKAMFGVAETDRLPASAYSSDVARRVYERLLDWLQQMVGREKIWRARPGDVDRWWRARSQMRLVPRGGDWEIEGPEKDRARLAYAVLDGDRLTYELAGAPRMTGARL